MSMSIGPGLALFLLPKRREDGELNYTIRRLKDKVATRSVPTGEVELRAVQRPWMPRAVPGHHRAHSMLRFAARAAAMTSRPMPSILEAVEVKYLSTIFL